MKKVIVFGLGRAFKFYKEGLYSDFDIVALTDNNEIVRSSYINADVNVISPNEICKYDFEGIILAVSGFFTTRSIIDQLLEYGIEPEKIYYKFEGGIMPSKGVATWNGIDVFISTYSDYVVWQECLVHGAYDCLDKDFLWTVFDIGMNIGCASLFFANLPNVRTIYAYELVKSTFQMAISNFERNSCLYKKIQAFPFGLGKENTTIEIAMQEYTGGNSMFRKISDGADVGVCDVHKASDELCTIIDKINTEDKIAIKIDVEGAEYWILHDLYLSGALKKIDMILGEYHLPQRIENGKRAGENFISELESCEFHVSGFDINTDIGIFKAVKNDTNSI